ncbi:hypothetical protein [Amycolatopsis azurea]|uniref:Uncharacterized protein n=1 Tax=Amycolatopsis azurea DSM 43854 TaxID=1238180 RepID=M2NSI0_9PSEU|nr:hypothetical protein [Amycolatopsis azurea]EMD25309.1 hypothetical protein C791_4918 [Amycolatopsis azurea DSM 43854]OOC02284.1 hypothetical protein B0293_33155 [Amycolatopsis azurea DSM 43854]
MTRDPVLVLDVREPGHDRTQLEAADEDVAELYPGYVVVVACVRDLPAHDAAFRRLAGLSQLEGVVLVATGPLNAEDGGSMLRTPAALRSIGVTLWVGDESGVLWNGASHRAVERTEEVTLADLLTALRQPLVFARVHKAVSQIPHQAVSPGLDIEYATVPDSTLRLLRVRALRHLATAEGDSGGAPAGSIGSAIDKFLEGHQAEDPATLVQPGSALDRARAASGSALTAARNAVDLLSRPMSLVRRRLDPVAVFREAGDALTAYLRIAGEIASAITGMAAGGPPQTAKLVDAGLPAPVESRSRDLAAVLEETVEAGLVSGRPLPGLAREAKQKGNELIRPDDPALRGGFDAAARAAERVRRTPRFTVWPFPMVPLLCAVLLTCAAGAALGSSGVVVGPALVVLWIGLLHRLLYGGPARAANATRLVLSVVAVAAVGAAVGHKMRFLSPPEVSTLPASLFLGLLLAAAAVTAAMLAWRDAVSRWTACLPLGTASAAHRDLVATMNRLVTERWLPITGLTRLADSLFTVAAALDGVAKAFAETADQFGPGTGSVPDSSGSLTLVLRQDLARIATDVLRPVFGEIAVDAPLTGDDQRCRTEAREHLARYNHHLDHRGITVPPSGRTDDEHRQALAGQLWHESAKSRRILLAGPRSPLAQLCRSRDLRLLSFDNVTMVHFAPPDLPDPALNPDYELLRPGGNAVGVLRLVPLFTKYVRQAEEIQPEET